jgi:hypothetical protein
METTSTAPAKPEYLDESHNFSLVLGGPLFQLFRKAHLEGSAAQLLPRRIFALTALVWLPLLLLALGSSGSATRVSFFRDVEVHVRFLVALPVLIAAELIVHQRIRAIVARFVDWGIVPPQSLLSFHRAIRSAIALRNSTVLEAGLFLCIYAAGLWLW